MKSLEKQTDLELIMLIKIAQGQKDKYHIFSLICGYQLENILIYIYIYGYMRGYRL